MSSRWLSKKKAAVAGTNPTSPTYHNACMKGFLDFGIVGTAAKKDTKMHSSTLVA